MVSWILLALSYAFLHSLVSMLDKILLKSKNIDPTSLSAYRFLINSIVAGILLFALRESIAIKGTSWIYIFSITIIYTISALAYFSAIKIGDVSKIVPLGQGMTIVLSFLLALFLLHEATAPNDIIGTLVIAIGSYIVLTDGKIEIPKISKELMFLVVWAITLALWGVISKSVTEIIKPSIINFFMYSFTALNLFIINSITDFKRFSNVGKTILTNTKLLWTTLLSSIFATIGTFLFFIALSIGNASEVLPVSRTLPLFTVLWGWLILKEKHPKIRFIGSLLIVLGIFLIYY